MHEADQAKLNLKTRRQTWHGLTSFTQATTIALSGNGEFAEQKLIVTKKRISAIDALFN